MSTQTSPGIWTAPPQVGGQQDAVDTAVATPPPVAPLDLPALLELADHDLHDLFCVGPSLWARQLNQLERTFVPSGDQLSLKEQRDLDRVRDVLRAAMWTHHRWVTWKVE